MDRRALILGGAAVAVGAGAAASFASMGASDAYARSMSAFRAPMREGGDARELVRYATLAPNGHNTQPWRFKVAESIFQIAPDFSRRTPAVDPDDHHLYVSLGAAAENLSLAALARGLAVEPRFNLSSNAVVLECSPTEPQSSALFRAIPHRQSTRAIYDGRTVSNMDLLKLTSAAQSPGVNLVLITERAQLNRVRDLVVAGNNIQMADRAFMAELKHWLRFNPRAALKTGDGLYGPASGNPALPDWLGPIMFDLAFKPESENDKHARHLASSSGVAVFIGDAADPEHWIAVGRACQRFALQATALGIKVAFINQPVEVANLRPELAALAGAPDRRPDIAMRFGYGPTLPMSPRRSVEAVIEV